MDERILDTIKTLLGEVDSNYDDFNAELIIHINDALSRLKSLGVGVGGSYLVDGTETWSAFTDDEESLPMVQSYVYFKIKPVFDPPEHSFTVNTFEKLADKYEWLLACRADEYSTMEG